MQRVVHALVALLVIAAFCGELTCFAEDEAAGCCETTVCAMCAQSASIDEPVVVPTPVVGSIDVLRAILTLPESPDLARLTPPPRA